MIVEITVLPEPDSAVESSQDAYDAAIAVGFTSFISTMNKMGFDVIVAIPNEPRF